MHAPSADASLPNGDRALTVTQRQTLSAWLSALHDRDERHGFSIELALTLAGDKPACLIHNFDLALDRGPFDTPAEALEFNHKLGIVTKQLYKSNVWYSARTYFRLSLLPSSGSTKAGTNFQRRMGVFFGYPEPDVEWFIRTPPTERISPRARAENGEFSPVELAYVDLVPYCHETSIAGYERAIAVGKQIRQRITVLANRWRLPILDALATDHYELSRKVYAGEREHFPGEFIGFKLTCKNPELE